MKYIRFIVFLLLCAFLPPLLVGKFPFLLFGIFFCFLSLAAMHWILRKNQKMKPYYLSSLNIFSPSHSSVLTSDLSQDLFLLKIKEILSDNNFQIFFESPNQLSATTPPTMRSWGENIYFDFYEEDGTNSVKVDSVSVFTIIDWDKNESNKIELFEQFDNSLII